MKHPLFQLVSAQLKGFIREPGILFWAFGFPAIMAWVLGVAFESSVRTGEKVAMIGNSTQIETVVKNAGMKGESLTLEEAGIAIKKGKVVAILSMSDNGQLQLRYDPRNAEAELVRWKIDKALAVPGRVKLKLDEIHETGSRYIDYLIPGLMAMGIMNACMWGTGWLMVEFRMKKLLRAMIAASMSKFHFLLSFMITRILANILESGILFLFAVFYFHVRLQGSALALILVLLCGIIAFSGIAVAGASRAAGTQSGNGILNAVTMPMMILSGVFFSYHNFPDWAIPIVQKLPLTLIADSIRSVFNEGAGLSDVAIPCALLVATGSFFFALGMRLYRWY